MDKRLIDLVKVADEAKARTSPKVKDVGPVGTQLSKQREYLNALDTRDRYKSLKRGKGDPKFKAKMKILNETTDSIGDDAVRQGEK